MSPLKLETIKTEVIKIAESYKDIKKVKLVGSYAKGKETENSDIDLIVALEEDFSVDTFFDFQEDMEMVLGKRIDLMEETGVADSILSNSILEGTVELYNKDSQ